MRTPAVPLHCKRLPSRAQHLKIASRATFTLRRESDTAQGKRGCFGWHSAAICGRKPAAREWREGEGVSSASADDSLKAQRRKKKKMAPLCPAA